MTSPSIHDQKWVYHFVKTGAHLFLFRMPNGSFPLFERRGKVLVLAYKSPAVSALWVAEGELVLVPLLDFDISAIVSAAEQAKGYGINPPYVHVVINEDEKYMAVMIAGEKCRVTFDYKHHSLPFTWDHGQPYILGMPQ